MDSTMMNAYKALNRSEGTRPQQQGEVLLEITLNMEKSVKEIGGYGEVLTILQI